MINVIVFADYIKSGCSFWRAQGPYSELHRQGLINLTEGIYTGHDWVSLRKNDVAVFQRPMSKNVKEQVLMAKDLGLKVIIDLDDVQEIPPWHPVYDVWCKEYNENAFRKMMLVADAVTVTTPNLKKHYLKYNNNVHLVPNAINDHIFKFGKCSENNIIMMRAGSHHMNDIWGYRKEIIEVVNKSGYDLIAVGGDIEFFKGKIENFVSYQDLIIHQYFALLLRTKPSIFIVPLANNELNHSKSNISWQEGTLCGAATLTPGYWGLHKYSATYTDNKTFKDNFEKLVEDREMRKDLWTKSVQKIKSDYVLSKVNEQRLEIIKNLLK